jgi:hypothetical protein
MMSLDAGQTISNDNVLENSFFLMRCESIRKFSDASSIDVETSSIAVTYQLFSCYNFGEFI